MAKGSSQATETTAPIVEVPATDNQVRANGQKKRPFVSFPASTDRTTTVEASVWGNEVTGQDGSTWTQYSITFRRSYKDARDGKWHDSGSLKGHDLPVLLHLLGKAHSWVLDQRTTDSSSPF